MLEFKDRIKQAVEEYLKSQNLNFSWNEDKEQFELSFSFDGVGEIHVICAIRPEEDQTQCKVYTRSYSIDVPEAKRGEVAQFLIGINYHSILQGFQMDISDGQVLFESLLFCYHDIVPPQTLIERYFDVAVFEMKKALSGMMLIIHGDMSATTVLQKHLGRD